jgi:hypothetical protein
MTEIIQPYKLNVMSGCLTGKVPTLTDYIEAILTQSSVKIFIDNYPHYGYLRNYNPLNQTFNFEKSNGDLLENLPINEVLIFSGIVKMRKLFTKGSSLIINQELFTAVEHLNDFGLTIWVGDNNLVYYGEDIEALIKEHGSYNFLGVC